MRNLGSFSLLPLKIHYEFTPDFDLELEPLPLPGAYFPDVLDKDLICLNTKIHESMHHLSMEISMDLHV